MSQAHRGRRIAVVKAYRLLYIALISYRFGALAPYLLPLPTRRTYLRPTDVML